MSNAFDLVEVLLAGGAHRQQLLIVGIGCVGEDGRGLFRLRVAAEAPAAGGSASGASRMSDFSGRDRLKTMWRLVSEARVVEAGLPEGDAALVGEAVRQEPAGRVVAGCAAACEDVAGGLGGWASPRRY